MSCLKCGKETEPRQVFCQECRTAMQKYRVSPNAVVHLPRRNVDLEKKPVYEKEQTEADVIIHLKRMIRWMALTIGILTLLLCLMAGLLFNSLSAPAPQTDIGKNYSTFDTSTTP